MQPTIRRPFFCSSRRRHTSWTGDWSSDVCSSDLTPDASSWSTLNSPLPLPTNEAASRPSASTLAHNAALTPAASLRSDRNTGETRRGRSEERRVGKECRCGWAREDEKKKRERARG